MNTITFIVKHHLENNKNIFSSYSQTKYINVYKMGVPVYIFIVPYRARESFKNLYINHMPWILEDEKEPYEIIFSHQNDKQPFNRGAMKNLGFWYARQKYPNNYKQINFIFQDIDTIPGNKGLLNFKTTKGIVKHYFGFN